MFYFVNLKTLNITFFNIYLYFDNKYILTLNIIRRLTIVRKSIVLFFKNITINYLKHFNCSLLFLIFV